MDAHEPEPSNDRSLPHDGETAPRMKQRRPFQFSLKLALLMFAPVGMLSFMFRWLHEHEYLNMVLAFGVGGAFWGVIGLAVLSGIGSLARDPKEPLEPIEQDLLRILLAAILCGSGSACFVAFLIWVSKTFA